MTIALWIIAICEVVRAVQNFVQIVMIRHDSGARDNVYAEFVKSLRMDDREKSIKEFADYEPYARNFPAITIKSRLYLETLTLLNEQKAKIRSLEQTIEDICCGGEAG